MSMEEYRRWLRDAFDGKAPRIEVSKSHKVYHVGPKSIFVTGRTDLQPVTTSKRKTTFQIDRTFHLDEAWYDRR